MSRVSSFPSNTNYFNASRTTTMCVCLLVVGCTAGGGIGGSEEDGTDGPGKTQGGGMDASSADSDVPGATDGIAGTSDGLPLGTGGTLGGIGGTFASGGASTAGETSSSGGEPGSSAGGSGEEPSASGGASETGGSVGSGGVPSADCSGGTVGTSVGNKAKDFAITDADGGQHTLSNYCGHVVVLEVGSPECGICASNAEHLPEFAAPYAALGVVFMTGIYEGPSPAGQNNGTTPTPTQINAFVRNTPLTPSFYDTKLWNQFKLGSQTPGLVIIGKDGLIKYKAGGDRHKDYKPYLDAAVAE